MWEPQCEHEKLGRVLAGCVAHAANAIHILEIPGQGLIEGLGLGAWQNIRANYIAEMDANLVAHRATCEHEPTDQAPSSGQLGKDEK